MMRYLLLLATLAMALYTDSLVAGDLKANDPALPEVTALITSAETIAVDGGKASQVQLSAGADDGVRAGDELTIIRPRTGNVIGRVRVVKVRPDDSAAVPVEANEAVVFQPGDRALMFKRQVTTRPIRDVTPPAKATTEMQQAVSLSFDEDVNVTELAAYLRELFRYDAVTCLPDPTKQELHVRAAMSMRNGVVETAKKLGESELFQTKSNEGTDDDSRSLMQRLLLGSAVDAEGLRKMLAAEQTKLASLLVTNEGEQPNSQKVKAMVARIYDARQGLHAAELQANRARLQQIEERLLRRHALRDQIIDRRTEQLVQGKATIESILEPRQLAGNPTALQQSRGTETLSYLGSSTPLPMPVNRRKQIVAEVSLQEPHGLVVDFVDSSAMHSGSGEKTAPARVQVMTGGTIGFRLTRVPAFDGVELTATVQVAPVTVETKSMYEHNALPIRFTAEDFEQATAGNMVTKVLLLPKAEHAESATMGVESLVSTRLDPGVDPIAEARRRGAVLAVISLGNRSPDSLNRILRDRNSKSQVNDDFKAPVPTVSGVDGEYIELHGSDFGAGMPLYVYRDTTTEEGFVGVATTIPGGSAGREIAQANPSLCVKPFAVGDKVYYEALHEEAKTHRWFLAEKLANARAERERTLIMITEIELSIAEVEDEVPISESATAEEREQLTKENRVLRGMRARMNERLASVREELKPVDRKIKLLEERLAGTGPKAQVEVGAEN